MRTMFALMTLAVSMTLFAGCNSPRSGAHDAYWSASEIKQSRLQKATLPEIEAGKHKGLPVPEESAGWQNFKQQAILGDQIWYFCMPPLLAKGAIGWRGYALYRGETLIATFTVADN